MLEDEPVVEEEQVEATATGDGAPKKKRTRRGTRGGRGRKKPTAPASEGADETPVDPGNGRPAQPRIHVPPTDLEVAAVAVEAPSEPIAPDGPDGDAPAVEVALGPDGQPKRKRARRGSRGGKKRRKPAAANGDVEASASDETAADEPVADAPLTEEVVSDGDPPAYVPMSEWIDDFDPRSRA